MVDDSEIELAHADAETERIRRRVRRVERPIGREGEQSDEIGRGARG